MDEVTFEHKLEVAAKAFFRDDDGECDWKSWEDAKKDMQTGCSESFIESVYKVNMHDSTVNSKVRSSTNPS